MALIARTLRDGCDGALVGMAATAPMTAVMHARHLSGAMRTQPPREVADAALTAAGLDPGERPRRAAAVGVHLGIGAAMGAPFAVAVRVLPPGPVSTATAGAGYGLGLWAAAYMGLVPALGVMPRADRDQRGRPRTMMLAHVVYGVVLAAGLRRVQRD